jgi:hypothetical protein
MLQLPDAGRIDARASSEASTDHRRRDGRLTVDRSRLSRGLAGVRDRCRRRGDPKRARDRVIAQCAKCHAVLVAATILLRLTGGQQFSLSVDVSSGAVRQLGGVGLSAQAPWSL